MFRYFRNRDIDNNNDDVSTIMWGGGKEGETLIDSRTILFTSTSVSRTNASNRLPFDY